MSRSELAQLELLAQVDELVARLRTWADGSLAWQPLLQARALAKRLLMRVETLRVRLETPLVVATFGGTGTGKSSLVNALVGEEITQAGRQRPTTRQPVLIAHPDLQLEPFGFPLDEFKIVRKDSPLLRDLVLLDCPDPDTNEAETPGSNLERLHQLLPLCDVLLYVSTQQKYRSARVGDELAEAAQGCRLIFVQSHADLDEDIRDDWRSHLAEQFRIAEMFFVDSRRALTEQLQGQRSGGEFGRLVDLLIRELSASHRVRIRRSNLLDLVEGTLLHCQQQLQSQLAAVGELEYALEQQRQRSVERMAGQLGEELLLNRQLWERRLLDGVTQRWGFSPFSSVLRVYNSQATLLASWALMRARTPAQIALVGAMHGAQWLAKKQQELTADARVEGLPNLGFTAGEQAEAQLVLDGYIRSAKLEAVDWSNPQIRSSAEQAQRLFLADATRMVDDIITEVVARNSGTLLWLRYEVVFAALWGFLLFRIGKNFFYESFWQEQELLQLSFYLPAAIFLLMWAGGLLILFTQRLRKGLDARIRRLADELAHSQVQATLFPQLHDACQQIHREVSRLEQLCQQSTTARNQASHSPLLSAKISPK